MKQFEIPSHYHSPIISKVKSIRKISDPRKKDFSPSLLDFGKFKFYISRHFGFCYGVENAIEISYNAVKENPDKRIFLLSQMIHNPAVNDDLQSQGIKFIQDTYGKQIIPWSEITSSDIVIIPAFGTTLEIEKLLIERGVNIQKYNTTCPFVEKVWNRAEKLGQDKHTIIIHGKANHEETRATFSHSNVSSPTLVIKDLQEAIFLSEVMKGVRSSAEFYEKFEGKISENFNVESDLNKIGVINQTTMLASETQEITNYLRQTIIDIYGQENTKDHIADTRDTLCYATNDNQSATYGLLEKKGDLAIVVGGYNSSNTTHLVELLEKNMPTFFIKDVSEILNSVEINTFDIHKKEVIKIANYLPEKEVINIFLTSGASCPDSLVDEVIQKIISFDKNAIETALVLKTLENEG